MGRAHLEFSPNRDHRRQGDRGVDWQSPIEGARWLRSWRLGEWLRGPVSPLFETSLLPHMVEARESAGNRRFGWQMPRMFRMRRPAHCVLNGHYFARADPDPRSALLLPFRFLSTELLGGWLGRFEQRTLPAYEARLAQTAATDHDDPGALLPALDALMLDVAELWYALGLTTGGAIPLQKFLSRASGGIVTEGDTATLLGGFETPPTLEQQSLWSLARDLDDDAAGWLDDYSLDELLTDEAVPEELASWVVKLRAHLERFGHQIQTFDFRAPCLAEEPSRLGAALRCYLTPDAREPRAAVASAAAKREALCAQILRPMKGPKRNFYQSLLTRTQGYTQAREVIVDAMQRAWPRFRAGFGALGNVLAGAGALRRASDVYFLTRDELGRFLAAPAAADPGTATTRHERWQAQQRLVAPISVPPTEDPLWQTAATWPVDLRINPAETERAIHGTGASPGHAEGRARVLGFASEQTRFAAGEVLVTVATTPDWTPYFALAAAVVTDVGGMASHSSIVAREYGIPAVVGTNNGTTSIRDGDLLSVDGSTGIVTILDPAPREMA